jgi:hypothetical protein
LLILDPANAKEHFHADFTFGRIVFIFIIVITCALCGAASSEAILIDTDSQTSKTQFFPLHQFAKVQLLI